MVGAFHYTFVQTQSMCNVKRESNASHDLCLIMCQYSHNKCNKCPTVVGDFDRGVSSECEGIPAIPVAFISFAMDLKLL